MRVFVYVTLSILCLLGVVGAVIIGAFAVAAEETGKSVRRRCERWIRYLDATGHVYLKRVEEIECRTTTRNRATASS